MKNIAVYAEVSSLYYFVAKKWPGKKLDYKALLAKLADGNSLYRAFAYGSHKDNQANSFIACLRHIGYEPKFAHGPFNWNVEMTLDVVRLIDKLDVVYLCTNDRELIPLINWIREHGVKTVIVGVNVNRDLRETADGFLEITESLLERPLELIEAVKILAEAVT